MPFDPDNPDTGSFRIKTNPGLQVIGENTAVQWPLVAIVVGLAFGLGGSYFAISSHGIKLDDHESRLRAGENINVQLLQYMKDHDHRAP